MRNPSNRYLFFFCCCFLCLLLQVDVKAQIDIKYPTKVSQQIGDNSRMVILGQIDSLLSDIQKGKIRTALISTEDSTLNRSIFMSIRSLLNGKELVSNNIDLINLYKIGPYKYWATIAFTNKSVLNKSRIKLIFSIIIDWNIKDEISFSTPLRYLTKDWKIKRIKNIHYYYLGNFKRRNAVFFAKKNKQISELLGTKRENFNFYLCYNYQDILSLLGYTYDESSFGIIRDGYGVDSHTIFSIMHNEDFSHDLLHYYSAKIRTKTRNSLADEGFAYLLGNAYYTNSQGEMINYKDLIKQFKNFLIKNPDSTISKLFKSNSHIFPEMASEISGRSLIAAIMCDMVLYKKGKIGVRKLLNCGSGDDNFFNALNDLVNVDENNYTSAVQNYLHDIN